MKLKQWLYGAAALAMLAACSDKDIAPDTGGEAPETGSGFIGVRIQLPAVPSTRANDSFDDGVASEYTLSTASLVLFRCEDAVDNEGKYDEEKDTPSNAKCIGAYELRRSKDQADKNPNPQITTEVIRFASVSGMTKNENLKLYALVMANGSKYNLSPSTIESQYKGKTIKELQQTFTTELLYSQATPGKGYASDIFMCSSPLFSKYKGGANNPNDDLPENVTELPAPDVLVEIDRTTYSTEQEAIDKPAGTIHIERAVGKVTCSQFTAGNDPVKVNYEGKEYTLEVESVCWDLCQDMEKTYLVRNTHREEIGNTSNRLWSWNYSSSNTPEITPTAPAGMYRMIGHTEIPVTKDGTTTNYYRPYFCQVPGYNKKKSGDTKDNYEDKTFRKVRETPVKPGLVNYMVSEEAVEWKENSAFYPHENTFPVEFMKYANTTRIGFWVTFKFKDKDGNELNMTKSVTEKDDDGNDITVQKKKNFYTRGLDRSTIYLDNPLEKMAGNYVKGLADLKKAFTDAMKSDQAGKYDNFDLCDFIDFKIEESSDGDGQVVVSGVSFKYTTVEAMPDKYQSMFQRVPSYDFSKADNGDLISNINKLEQVYEYKEGKVFYDVRIQHFGEDLTPWDPATHQVASNIQESYGPDSDKLARNNNYLGRYGIVRNNWYDLKVTAITKLGPPVDPAKWDDSWPGKPDDNKDEYIAVILRVLSWAKRTQNVIF